MNVSFKTKVQIKIKDEINVQLSSRIARVLAIYVRLTWCKSDKTIL